MKNILQLLAPIGIVVILFIAVTSWQKNYDPRYTESHEATATIVKKKIRPEGMYKTSYVVNKIVRYTETWSPEKCMITVVLDGKEYEIDTDMALCTRLNLNDEVQVMYQEPKYFGDPFNITMLDP